MLRIGMMTENISIFRNMKESLKTIKDIGYECADITFLTYGNHPKLNKYFSNKDYLRKALELKEYADSINLPLVQAHAPFPVYKFNDEKYNKKMFDILVKCIKACGVMKIKNLVIHPFNDFSDDENVEFFNKLIPYAKESNVVICCENMWRWNKEIDKAKVCSCSLPGSFNNIINKVNSDYLKACVDIGHAEMFSYIGVSARKMLEALNDKVYCLHIHDNDLTHDLHQIPYSGSIDFNDVINGLKNINYKGDLIVETKLPKKSRLFIRTIEFYENQLKVMNNLKQKLIKG